MHSLWTGAIRPASWGLWSQRLEPGGEPHAPVWDVDILTTKPDTGSGVVCKETEGANIS